MIVEEEEEEEEERIHTYIMNIVEIYCPQSPDPPQCRVGPGRGNSQKAKPGRVISMAPPRHFLNKKKKKKKWCVGVNAFLLRSRLYHT